MSTVPPPTCLTLLVDARVWRNNGYKFHAYHGPCQNIALSGELRHALGDDFVLMIDPVCSYSLEEAIEVGHAKADHCFL